MALTAEEQRLASRWWIEEVFKKPKKPAAVSVPDIIQAVIDGDAWYDAAPAGGASNGAAFKAAIDIGFRTALSDAGFVVNDAIALLSASITLARSGALPA